MLPLPIRLAALADLAWHLLPAGHTGALLAAGLIVHELSVALRDLWK